MRDYHINTIAPGYITLKFLAELFGVKLSTLRKWMLETGLRVKTEGKPKYRPSHRAFDLGLVEKIHNGRNGNYFYVWEFEKTIALLEKAGHHPLVRPAAPVIKASGSNGRQ